MGYNEEAMRASNAIGAQMIGKQEIMDRTIGQIEHHKREIVRLEGIAAQMRAGASMLDLRIEDLRRVMQY